jgi:hypothetical protein
VSEKEDQGRDKLPDQWGDIMKTLWLAALLRARLIHLEHFRRL